MKKLMKKQERLNDIFLKLCKGEVKIKNLAKLYNTTERTIQNDIKELSQIYNIISPKKGIYKLEMDLTIKEKFEEVFTKFIIKANYDIFYQFENLIKKLEIKSGFTPTKFFEINTQLEILKEKEILIDLIQAIEWNFALNFEYKNKKRIIQPLKILNYNTIWYLIGFDLEKNKLKTFKINKIKNLISKTENYLGEEIKKLKEKTKKISSPWIEEKKYSSIIQVYYPLSENIHKNVIKKEKNFVEVKIEYFNEKEAFEIIKQYIPYVKIKDKNLKEKMKKFLNQSLSFI